MEREDRFKYNLSLEYAMQRLFGSKHYSGMAGGFRDPVYCRKCLLRVAKRIRNRFLEIPMDERLIETTSLVIDDLEKDVKKISEKVNNDWEIITDLLRLVIYLLGYDWLDGRVHRQVIFFQSLGQEQEDWKMRVGNQWYYDRYRLEEKRRYMLVNQLSKNKVPKYQIARLLGLSIKRVGQILSEIPEIEKSNGKSIPSFE